MSSSNLQSFPKKAYFSSQTLREPIVIQYENDFRQLGFLGSGTQEDPYIIANWIIESNGNCISISYTQSHFRVRNCILINGGFEPAISFQNVSNGIIEDCEIIAGDGITFRNCASIDLVGNVIAGPRGPGVYIVDCDEEISISDNRIFYCETGIFVENTDSCIITMNRIYCNRFGIHLLADTQFNVIGQNSLGWNENQDNRFQDGIDGDNAHDAGNENHWDGNRWSDYRSYSTEYDIGGPAFALDHFPSPLTDFSAPVITSSDIDTVIQGNTSAFLIWTIIEEFPFSYEIHQNGIIIDEGYITSEIITQPLGLLPYGVYNFTILVTDGVGYVETLQRTISVVNDYGMNEPLVYSLILSVGIFAGAIVIVTVDHHRTKKRKNDELEYVTS
jgi:hypothetical protein